MLSVYSPLCEAQTLAPVIYLSSAETAKAAQSSKDLKAATDRDNRAKVDWRSFNQVFQASHPELPGLRFSADYRIAFAVVSGGFVSEMKIVDLSPEERTKLEGLYKEMRAAKEALDKAFATWQEFQRELVANHIATQIEGADKWTSGIAFSPDFRIIVPVRVF